MVFWGLGGAIYQFCGGQERKERHYSWSRIPALWIKEHPAQRREVSRSTGTPSAWLGEEASCSAVARGLQRRETMWCLDMW